MRIDRNYLILNLVVIVLIGLLWENDKKKFLILFVDKKGLLCRVCI